MNNCPDRRTMFSIGKKSTAQSQQISHCAVHKSHGSFAPPCIDADVQAGMCAIGGPDVNSPSGQPADCALVENEVTFTARDDNSNADIT